MTAVELGRLTLACLLLVGLSSAGAQDPAPSEEGAPRHRHVQEQPRDHEAYIAMLEREERDEYQRPEQVLDALCLEGGMDVADIGAGSGYFTRRLAPRVAPGTVYALDIEKPFLEHLEAEAAGRELANVETVLTAPERPDLPDDSVDLVLIVNTWHHIPTPRAYARHLRRILRPGGRLVHIDWRKEKTPFGPPMDHRLARDELVAEMEGAGFRLWTEHFFLPYQYFLVFRAVDHQEGHEPR